MGKLSMTAAGRRMTDTTRRVAVSAETGVDASDASYAPPVVEKAEDVQAAMMHCANSTDASALIPIYAPTPMH